MSSKQKESSFTKRMLNLASAYFKSRFFTHYPFFLAHAVTFACNSRCKTCTMWKMTPLKFKDLSLNEVKRLIDEAYNIGMRGYYAFGGEPLVRRDIVEIIKYAYEKGFVTTVNTNGSLLYPLADELSKYLDVAFVSLDFPGPYHDYIRGFPGNFERLIKGVKRLLEIGKTRVIFVSTISKLNYGHIKDLAEFAAKVGVGISYNAVEPTLVDYDKVRTYEPVFDYGLTKEQLREFYKTLYKLKLEGYPLMESEYILKHYAEGKQFKCHFPKIFVYVSPDGYIFPCTFRYGLKNYSLKEGSFKEYFKSEAFKRHVKLSEHCDVCIRTCIRMYAYTYELRVKHIVNLVKSLKTMMYESEKRERGINFLDGILKKTKEEQKELQKAPVPLLTV
ncbi:MAG: radical SAM protein [Candidatus Odinarchaeota archaeon]|nr:radical SAM protein [Candidatus Odinarchaeota archaeon]